MVRPRVGWIGLVLLGLLGGTALLTAATPLGRYIARAAWEEGKILRGRRAIREVIADSTTPAATRAKLELVLAARAYAGDSLGLPAKEVFTQFTQLSDDTLVLVLSGTRRDALVSATWWFPVVGRVPYKGFFKTDAALRAERELAAAGYDTYLRPAPAFSTLGWFNDPLLSTTLASDSIFLAQTVIHELTHNRLYVKNEAVFNESFAEFVGNRGAAEFFRSRGDSLTATRAEARWRDEMRLGVAWERGYRALDSMFKAHPYSSDRALRDTTAEPAVRARRLTGRDSVYAWLRRLLVDSIGPQLETFPAGYATRVRLDNAALLARRIYATGLGDFEALWARSGMRVRPVIDSVGRVAADGSRGATPFARVNAIGQP